MKLLIIGCVAMLATVPVSAQLMNTAPPSRDTAVGTVTTNRLNEGYWFGNTHLTPTMQRQKLTQAIALRDEAAKLLAQDGGTLSERNATYIRRKAARISSYSY